MLSPSVNVSVKDKVRINYILSEVDYGGFGLMGCICIGLTLGPLGLCVCNWGKGSGHFSTLFFFFYEKN